MQSILPKMMWTAWITIEIGVLTVFLSCVLGGLLSAVRILGGRLAQ